MKKVFLFLGVFLLVLSFSGVASATYIYNTWYDYDYIGEKISSYEEFTWYDLSIAVADDFRPGIDYVTYAKVSFWLSDDSFYDGAEYAWVWLENSGWSYAGEIDFYDKATVGLSNADLNTLNTYGDIYTAVKSTGGDFYWKAAKLTAKGYKSVPEPGTIFLLGFGLLGLAGLGRKKLIK